MSASKTVKIVSQGSLIDAKRRLLLRNGAAIALSGAAVALLAGREALAQSTAASPRITQRTLVVNGGDDIMVPTVNSFILQQRLPDARLILFPNSGHGSHFQYPEEFAEAAVRFLGAA